jgi:hypothetical protein
MNASENIDDLFELWFSKNFKFVSVLEFKPMLKFAFIAGHNENAVKISDLKQMTLEQIILFINLVDENNRATENKNVFK